MRLRITRLTLFIVAVILGLGFARLLQLLLRDIESQTFQATEEVMVDVAYVMASLPLTREMLADGMNQASRRDFEARIFDRTKTEVGLGVYLADRDGVIRFDSAGIREGEDYARFNDVYLALRGEYGARSSRVDETDPNSSILYVAAPVMENDEITGVLTVYKQQSDGRAFIESRKKSILTTTILMGVGMLALIAAVFWWLFRPVGRLTDYAQSISRGERPPRPRLGLGREVNTLSGALEEMRETLEGRQYAERYVQTLTHELKSPLSAIRGAAELLDEDMPREDRARFLANIRSECGRSQRVIDRLLALSELEGRTHLDQVERVELGDLVRRICVDHEAAAHLEGVRFVEHCQGKHWVSGDPVMLRAALENLVENALGFSPRDGEITISVTQEPGAEGNQGTSIRVADQGEGFPEYALERAFERFFSIRASGDNRSGSGLGLAFVRETAELHGGETGARNRHGGGAEVWLWLPRESA